MKKLIFCFLLLAFSFSSKAQTVAYTVKLNSISIKTDSILTDTVLTIEYDTTYCYDTTFYLQKAVTGPIQGFDGPQLVWILRIDEIQQIVISGGIIKDDQLLGGLGRYWWYAGSKKNIPFPDLTAAEIEKLKSFVK